jgi:hypothetical protein
MVRVSGVRIATRAASGKTVKIAAHWHDCRVARLLTRNPLEGIAGAGWFDGPQGSIRRFC